MEHAKCFKCGLEWHVLANADPLSKVWSRFEPDFCPRCGRRISGRKCGGCEAFEPSDMSETGGRCLDTGLFRDEAYPSCTDWRSK